MSHSDRLGPILDVLAEELAERVAARLLNGQRPDWIDQASSPLGARRHRAAVKRRTGAGLPGAAIVGRRHMLSADALAEELAQQSRGKRQIAEASLEDTLRAELRLVEGGCR